MADKNGTTIASIMEEKSTLKTGRGEIGETTGTKRQPCLICWQDFKEGGTFKNIARPFKNVSRNLTIWQVIPMLVLRKGKMSAKPCPFRRCLVVRL
jgi:hypothetical protein